MTSSKIISVGLLLFFSVINFAESEITEERNKQLFWGDTHIHTNQSLDAYLNKNISAGPDEAYRFAKGLPVKHPFIDTKLQLDLPLDFLVVADHAENLGVFKRVIEGRAPTEGLSLVEKIKLWAFEQVFSYFANSGNGLEKLTDLYRLNLTTNVVEAAKDTNASPFPNTELMERDAWLENITAAEAHNDPGNFSAFIGWEWTSIPAAANLHRVVFSSSNADVLRDVIPFSANQSNYPEDLWHFLDETSEVTGADFIAIPHNSNVSRGYMFPAEKTLRNEPIGEDWISLRSRWENVVEITQIKGDSETIPMLSPEDRFADFEPYPYHLISIPESYQPKKSDFVRSALRAGLGMEQRLGKNPYKFGLIGSTDSHTGLSSAEEPNFWSKYAKDARPADRRKPSGEVENYGWQISASGLAAVWSEENTREAIFAAFKRREVYATTGPRIAIRVFAGADYVLGDEAMTDIALLASKGVPMGGELQGLSKSPSFVVHAAQDPSSASLDRVQIVKGWFDGTQTHEKIYDIVWAGERKPDTKGQVSKVPDTVDPETANYSNEYGASSLATVWADPDFNPAYSAFYYVRVLEVPTPRHSTFDAIALDIDAGTIGKPISIQERAYTSPIFYTP